MKISFFRRAILFESRSVRLGKFFSLALKCAAILLMPLPFCAAVTAFWYYEMFIRHFHFNTKMEVILTAAWIPTFTFVYGLLVAVMIGLVAGKYFETRSAVKRYDLKKFMELRDERLSPLFYALVGVYSMAVLGGFMSLEYPSRPDGIILVSSTSYVFALLFCVVREVDNPCAGLWYIHSIPEFWLKIDIKLWLHHVHEEEKKKYEAMVEKCLCTSKADREGVCAAPPARMPTPAPKPVAAGLGMPFPP